MRRALAVLCCLALLILAAAPLPAQEAEQDNSDLARGLGRIKGTVTGPDGRFVVAARVVARVALPDRDLIHLTTTDDSGTYYFETLPAGVYVVQAFVAGLALGQYDDVNIRPPFRTILDFRLKTEVAPDSAAAVAGPPGEDRGEPPAASPTAGELIDVHGLVLGEDAVPLPDAEIAFTGGPPPGRRLVLSRADGRLSLPDLPVAAYMLSITAPGTIPIRIPDVQVAAGRPLELQIGLVDFPVEMAAERGVILPLEVPLAPRRLLTIPPRPQDRPQQDPTDPPPPDPAGR